jgi:hypothetical protein
MVLALSSLIGVAVGRKMILDREARQTAKELEWAAAHPKAPRDWYRAEWHVTTGNTRRLYKDGRLSWLTLWVEISTDPNLPIQELYGRLEFVRAYGPHIRRTLYEAEVAEKTKKVFTRDVWVSVTICPYEEWKHRPLLDAPLEELIPVFTVSRVVLEDGTVKTFEPLEPADLPAKAGVPDRPKPQGDRQ